MPVRPLCCRWLVVLLPILLLSALAARPRPAGAEASAPAIVQPEEFLVLRGASRLLVEQRDGQLIQAAPVGVWRDSLILEQRRNRFRIDRISLARADVSRVWLPRHNPRAMAVVYGITGFAGGALISLGLGSNRQDLGVDPGEVFASGLGNGAVSVPLGALFGLLGRTWQQALPTPVNGQDPRPYPEWSISVLGGAAHGSSATGARTQVGGSIAGWKSSGRRGSWGFEYGTLSRDSRRYAYPAHYDSVYGPYWVRYVPAIAGESQSRWAYYTLQFRTRLSGAGAGPYMTFGLGSYLFAQPFSDSYTDSLGRVTHRYGRSITSGLGANAGAGVTWGRGPRQPDVQLRVHWAHDSGWRNPTWVTLQAGVLYQ